MLCCVLIADIEDIISEPSKHEYEELQWYWDQWREVTGKPYKDKFKEYVELQNKAAAANGKSSFTYDFLQIVSTVFQATVTSAYICPNCVSCCILKTLHFSRQMRCQVVIPGFSDASEWWLHAYTDDYPGERNFRDDLETIWQTMKPVYQKVHAYLRYK